MTNIGGWVFIIEVVVMVVFIFYQQKFFASIMLIFISSLILSWGVNLVPVTTTSNIFSFKDFIAALALLVIIYTISDIRYHFRISVSAAPLKKISYILICLIGFGTLMTDIWINEKWFVPNSLLTASIWQGILAVLFLSLVITWVYNAFIKPPIFEKNNYKKYSEELYRIVQKGSATELPIIAHELERSAKTLVAFAADLKKLKSESDSKLMPCAEGYANDMLLLIANRKFCRHIVASSPITVIRFLDAVTKTKAYQVPIGLFLQNISAEAIINKDSSLYHEDEGYNSGLLGYMKPFSHALYGNYNLIDELRMNTPLDIDYKLVWAWDAEQFEVYCRAVMISFKSYLENGYWNRHSGVLSRALREIRETTSRAISDSSKSDDDHLNDSWNRINTGINFMSDCIEAIGDMDPPPQARTLRIQDPRQNRFRDGDFYDALAEAMFNIIHSAAYIEGPPDKAWGIHYVSVWSRFFGLGTRTHVWRIVQFKLRRLLYDEILDLGTRPNFKAARILGICLNVMGLTMPNHSSHGRDYASLTAVVLTWTQTNYLRLRKLKPKIADACLIGSITFDAEKSQLVKTYAEGLSTEPNREFLPLQLST